MSELRVVLEGLVFPEGPRWHDDRLFFSDIHAGDVICTTPSGAASLVCTVPGLPSGLGWDRQGRLLIASTTTKSLVRLEDDGSLTTVADLSGLARSILNDMVVDAEGRAYIGDIGFELGRDDFRAGQVLLVQPDGSASIADDDMGFPNGSIVTPDGRTLIVGESFGGRLTAFDIGPDGTLSNKRVWAQLPGGAVPDGSCLDAEAPSGPLHRRPARSCGLPKVARCSPVCRRASAARTRACSVATTGARCSCARRGPTSP